MRYTVNFVLLGLLLITIVSMVLMVVYYHSTYGGLNKRYKTAISEVEAVAVDLNQTLTEVKAKESLLNKKEKELIDYIDELNLSKERESSLGDHFTELRGEKEDIERDLNATELEKEQWRENYYTAKQEFDVCKTDYKLKVSELSSAKRELFTFEEAAENLQSSSGELTDKVADVNNKIGDIGEDADALWDFANDIENATLKNQMRGAVSNLESNIGKLEQRMTNLESVINTIKAWISTM